MDPPTTSSIIQSSFWSSRLQVLALAASSAAEMIEFPWFPLRGCENINYRSLDCDQSYSNIMFYLFWGGVAEQRSEAFRRSNKMTNRAKGSIPGLSVPICQMIDH